MSSRETIPVTCALIVRYGRLLAVQHGPSTSHPYRWEFPGGKQKNGETSAEAVIREIDEELCVDVEIVRELVAVEHDYPHRTIRLIPFLCTIGAEQITLTEHVASRWLKPEELDNPEWSDADLELIRVNRESILKAIEHSVVAD